MMTDSKLVRVAGAALVLLLPLAACGGGGDAAEDPYSLSGMVTIDGSSTVFPISEAMAEEFQIANSGVRVTVGISGTGGGFKKFCGGETDISDASRPIKSSEIELCRENGIEAIEIPVAWDGLTVVRNPANDWATCMTVDELKRVWQPGSSITRWNQVRPEWPDEKIKLYGPDTDSGTFDYFTEAIVGEEDASRDDYTASADDNVLVVPSRETIENGSYAPLSRPMFIYTKAQALAKPQVRAFLQFYMDNATIFVPEVGYVPLAGERYSELLGTLNAN
jgi:phosphate transport system substrate-binding protein